MPDLDIPSSLQLVADGEIITTNNPDGEGADQADFTLIPADETPKIASGATSLPLTINHWQGSSPVYTPFSRGACLGPLPFGGVSTDADGATFRFDADRTYPTFAGGTGTYKGKLPINRDDAPGDSPMVNFAIDLGDQATDSNLGIWNAQGGIASIANTTILHEEIDLIGEEVDYPGINFGQKGFILRAVLFRKSH